METNRRDFMRGIGVMLASLLTTRCLGQTTCYVPAEPSPTPPTPTCYTVVPTRTPQSAAPEGKDWDRLRKAWQDLERLARHAPDLERGQKTHEQLVAEHQAALDRLVSTGQLEAGIADEMQSAYEGAAYHVWRANAPLTCYAPVRPPDYQFGSSSDLARQAELLAEMAEQSAIDQATVAQAQAAIERDIAFLAMTPEDQRALVETVRQMAGDTENFPQLIELDMDVPPESAEAARILIELLLARK
ncbi:MAG: hypothetical protein Kow0063_12600 [Anaerolineae bacterium]